MYAQYVEDLWYKEVLHMLARILFLPDLHKRGRDSDAIKGQMDAIRLIQKDIIALNNQYKFTHNIILGDWYHKGFHDLDQALGAIQEDRLLASSVNGNVYLLIGNHFYLERDCNPEMYIIQPNKLIKPIHDITMPETPIFKVVNTLRIGNVQIDFHHFSKVNKDYVAEREEGVTYRVGLYHDDKTLPSWVREKAGYLSGSVSQPYLNKIYEDIDIAIHGHIHTPLDVIKIPLASGKEVPVIIPGSLSIVTRKNSDVHDFVTLPILEINDDSTVTFKQIKQSTHRECLIFKEKTELKDMDMSDSLNSKNTFSMKEVNSISQFLSSHGHSAETLDLVHQLYITPMSLEDMVGYIRREKNDKPTVSV